MPDEKVPPHLATSIARVDALIAAADYYRRVLLDPDATAEERKEAEESTDIIYRAVFPGHGSEGNCEPCRRCSECHRCLWDKGLLERGQDCGYGEPE